MSDPNNCPFCNPDRDPLAENELCFAIPDKYPVSPGHTLVITRRHVADYFDLRDEEKSACWELVDEVKKLLETKYTPGGWNIGINIGSTAGQTVFHFHCHLIPRYEGDMEDPRGGVRHSVKGKGFY
jgi:diadenosine tetraphosphate (Ap4A) HIT family hydrolase